jgi:hypothetical protein
MLTTPVATHVVARAAALTNVPLWSGTVLDERREDRERRAPGAGDPAGEAEQGSRR